MENSPVYSVKLPYKTRCDICNKAINLVFKKVLDGIMCTFCSPSHVEAGMRNWQEKLDNNIRLKTPTLPVNNNYEADNVPIGGENT